MKLEVQKKDAGKGKVNALRREGKIPGILYGKAQAGTPICVKADEIHAVLRNMKPGLLATTIFELTEGSKKHRAIIKDIQYHVASYDVQHIDFVLLADDVPVKINVPVQMVGMNDCVGVKLGGFLRQVARSVAVSCLPKHIPQEGFTIDVRDMNIGQAKTLADVTIPSNV